MKRATTKPDWLTPEVRRHLERIEYEFQVREFGEEMARINFLPSKERKRQVGEMVDHARRKGVTFAKPVLGVKE